MDADGTSSGISGKRPRPEDSPASKTADDSSTPQSAAPLDKRATLGGGGGVTGVTPFAFAGPAAAKAVGVNFGDAGVDAGGVSGDAEGDAAGDAAEDEAGAAASAGGGIRSAVTALARAALNGPPGDGAGDAADVLEQRLPAAAADTAGAPTVVGRQTTDGGGETGAADGDAATRTTNVFGASFSTRVESKPAANAWGSAWGAADAGGGPNPWLSASSAAFGAGWGAASVTSTTRDAPLASGGAQCGGGAAFTGGFSTGDALAGDENGDDGSDAEAVASTEAHNAALLSEGGRVGGATAPVILLSEAPRTGEEDEVTILQLRAKLYVKEAATAADGGVAAVAGLLTGTGAGADAGDRAGARKGVAPSAGFGSVGAGGGASTTSATLDATGGAPPAGGAVPAVSSVRWRECGVGPLRVNVRRDVARLLGAAFVRSAAAALPPALATALERAAAAPAPAVPLTGVPARVIVRQEHHTGGHGSRLLLNAAVGDAFEAALHPLQERTITMFAFTEAPAKMRNDAGGGDTGEGGAGVTDADGDGSAGQWAMRSYLVRVAKAEATDALMATFAAAQRVAATELRGTASGGPASGGPASGGPASGGPASEATGHE